MDNDGKNKDWQTLNINCNLCGYSFRFLVPEYGENIVKANRIHITCPCCEKRIVINENNTTIGEDIGKLNEQERIMMEVYKKIAECLCKTQLYMKNHLDMVESGNGVVIEEDLKEVLKQLTDMINSNLQNVSQLRMSFE